MPAVSRFMIAQWESSGFPSIDDGDKRKKSSNDSVNSDWPYKCSQAMSEPIVDRAVTVMKEEELCE
jgi:hypothetical protein